MKKPRAHRRKTRMFQKHSKYRAFERFNLCLTTKDLQDIVKLIQLGQTKVIKIFSNTRTLHEVTFNEAKLLVVYNKKYKEIATIFEGQKGEYSG
jgi:hypothetical protein